MVVLETQPLRRAAPVGRYSDGFAVNPALAPKFFLRQAVTLERPNQIRPDIGALSATRLTDEMRFKVR